VPRSSYYYKAKPKESEVKLENKIQTSFLNSRKTYGTRRIKKDLQEQGHTVSRRKIGQIMAKYNLVSVYTLKSFKHGNSGSNKAETPNVLDQDFTATRPMEKLTTDLTYVKVGRTWHYTCLILDLYNREIVGWSVGPNKTADLVLQAMSSIPYDLRQVDIFHTDRGTEFVNRKLDDLLVKNGIQRSLSAPGTPYDNAVSERTYRAYKTEFVSEHKFESLEQLALLTRDYIHWWNNKRKHTTLGYLPPIKYKEQEFLNAA
jgi:transposase InsO family protein